MTDDGTGDGRVLVSEVFSAIQGEGLLVGYRQVFLRLTGCPLRCAYCDQPEALEPVPGPCHVERTPGARDFEVRSSPLPDMDVVDAVDRLWQALPHHSVSITGGEPLAQSPALARLAPRLVGRGPTLFVETAGLHVEGLRRVLPWVSYVSADLKLPSVDGQGVDPARQRAFLELAASAEHTTVYAKIVLGPRTDERELLAAVELVVDVAPHAAVFLQPVTPFAGVATAPEPEQVLAWQAAALAVHRDVRVVPQTHKAIGQR